MTGHRIDVAVLSIAFVIFGLVGLALLWSGGWAYEVLARATGHTSATFVDSRGSGLGSLDGAVVDLSGLLHYHGLWASYVIGLSSAAPQHIFFTAEEAAHMTDVRNVFAGANLAALAAAVVAIYRILRARRRRQALRVVRDAGLVAVGLVAGVGVAATVAFDPLFLLFHQIFFPQGNFLFPPESNLIRLYPEWYWQGITAGIGGSFIAIALLAAAGAHIALRRAATTYTRAA